MAAGKQRLKECGEKLCLLLVCLWGHLNAPSVFFFANVIYFIFVSNSATPFLTSLQDSVEYNFVHIVSEPVYLKIVTFSFLEDVQIAEISRNHECDTVKGQPYHLIFVKRLMKCE